LLNMLLDSMLYEKEITFYSLEVSVMSTHCFIRMIGLVLIGLALCPMELLEANSHESLLEAKAFELKGPTENLEKQKLDFRYASKRWQACIGLPDDPHKSIVGSDGGLYYDYGGGRFYDFNVRVVADLETEGNKGNIKQQLLDPRIPVVITEQQHGGLLLCQRAWARAPDSQAVEQWSKKRIDYLWLELENRGSKPQRERIVLKFDSDEPLQVGQDMQRVYNADGKRPFCMVSPKCVSYYPEASKDEKQARQILPQRLPSVSRNWGKPNEPCDERFRDILVGYNRPLTFTFPAEAGKKYCVAFGLIESWHKDRGKRPLELRIEEQIVHKVDLIAEYGQDRPVVLTFEAEDKNGDGLLEMGVHAAPDAEDKNMILTALWVFEAENAPSGQKILLGQADSQALAIYEVNSRIQNPLRLYFAEKELEPGQKEQMLVGFYRGQEATESVSVGNAQQELDMAIRYWKEKTDLPFDRIKVPDPAVQGLLDSCIRNIYQARELRNGEPAFQVGPTCYRGTWAADGPFILEAVTYLGRGQEARAGLELQVEKDEGPGGVEFSKKSGLRLWMILRHWQLTGDTPWLEKMWPKVKFNVDKIIEYRRMTMDDPSQVNYGLMPIGFGDGGLGGKHREYTNVYWTLAGLKATIEIAEQLEEPIVSTWKDEFKDYWDYFEKARNRDKLRDEHGNIYVPVTMKGEQQQLPQRGAWAFLQSIYPGRIFKLDDVLMRGTMAMLDANQREGLIFGTGWDLAGIWNYAGSFYGHAHLWLGNSRKAAATFYAFGNHSCPLLCWREEQNPYGEPEKYIGDMPHNWASAEFIRMVRHMLILERGKELHLLEGMPSVWSHSGDVIRLNNIPTSFGLMSLSVRIAEDGQSGWIRIMPPVRDRAEKIVVHLEHFIRPVRSVRKEGSNILDRAIRTTVDKEIELALDFEYILNKI
jgi:hypothetical protein